MIGNGKNQADFKRIMNKKPTPPPIGAAAWVLRGGSILGVVFQRVLDALVDYLVEGHARFQD